MKLLALVLLAGCGMIKTSSSGSSTTPSGGSTSGGGDVAPAPSGGASNGMVTMPNIVGKTEAEANAMLAAAGFKSNLEHSRPVDCDNGPKVEGKIDCQSPDAGAQIEPYTLVQVKIYAPEQFHGVLLRRQLKPLLGMTVEAGKAELARLGYHAKIKVEHPIDFIANCGLGKICEIEPEDGLSTIDPTAVVHLTVNEDTVKISTPDN